MDTGFGKQCVRWLVVNVDDLSCTNASRTSVQEREMMA